MITLAIVIAPPFGIADRLGLVFFGMAISAILHMLARSRVVADERGLTVVNPLRTHRYDWAEVLRVTMVQGDPWPTLDLADGTSVGAMGIQGSEGERARRAITELQALLRERGEAPEPI
ncbi:PH domain-containing protein [Actinomadura alba]|uniref:PH domain-containing protein n=2 Tax=Actinomadura alba TaxID=406431 RepID=A0ABR7LLW7_9ACTN|nr:PH domain-containing protein [Actinomadura alba]